MTIRKPLVRRSKSSNQQPSDSKDPPSQRRWSNTKSDPDKKPTPFKKKSPFGSFGSSKPASDKPVRSFRPTPKKEPETNINVYNAEKDQNSRTQLDCLGNKLKLGKLRLKELDQRVDQEKKRFAELNLLTQTTFVPPARTTHELGYRCHVKFAVRLNKNNYRGFDFGLFEPGTHNVVHATYCPTQHDSINIFLKKLEEQLTLIKQEETLSAEELFYDETSKKGLIRYICIRCNHITGELMTTFVCTSANKHLIRRLVKNLIEDECNIKSAYINLNTSPGNEIFGPQLVHVSGAKSLRESLNGISFEIGPLSFFQINPSHAAFLYKRITKHLSLPKPGTLCWDLYAGIGQISLHAAELGYDVTSIEEIPEAASSILKNARLNELNKIKASAERTEDYFSHALFDQDMLPRTVVVNPSRRGLAPEVRSGLKNIAAENNDFMCIYVSCNAETLRRDLCDLTEDENLVMVQLECVDMFPNTDKLEWIAVLIRK